MKSKVFYIGIVLVIFFSGYSTKQFPSEELKVFEPIVSHFATNNSMHYDGLTKAVFQIHTRGNIKHGFVGNWEDSIKVVWPKTASPEKFNIDLFADTLHAFPMGLKLSGHMDSFVTEIYTIDSVYPKYDKDYAFSQGIPIYLINRDSFSHTIAFINGSLQTIMKAQDSMGRWKSIQFYDNYQLQSNERFKI